MADNRTRERSLEIAMQLNRDNATVKNVEMLLKEAEVISSFLWSGNLPKIVE